MESGDTAEDQSGEQERQKGFLAQVQHDFLGHKSAYYAAAGGIVVTGVSLGLMQSQNGGWVGPVLLSLAILMVSIGFVGYQLEDARRTDARLDKLDKKLTAIADSQKLAVAALDSASGATQVATTDLKASSERFDKAAQDLRAAEHALVAQQMRPQTLAELLGFRRR